VNLNHLFKKEPITENSKQLEYLTIFGFPTFSKVAAIAIDIVYWFIIFVAYCFAFHALNNILITWNWFLVGLACFAVVGLPYCVKIILFGRKEFPIKAALLCLFLSLLPTIFDFTGFYSETGLQDSLQRSKVQISEAISTFEIQSKKSAQDREIEIQNLGRDKKTTAEQTLLQSSTDIQKQIEDANQQVLDEREGVRGKAGDGPRSKELQSQVRKLKAQSDIELQQSKAELKRQNDVIDQETNQKLLALKQSTALLGDKLITCKKEVNNAGNFKELELSVINANGLLSSIASNLNVSYIPVRIIGSDNIIKVSFGSLVVGDITALICFLLAFLMEIGDIIITFVMRYEKKVPTPIIETTDDNSLRHVKYTKTYEGY
jgi:hypothetical protein